jgi:hypothetical protein
MSNFVAAAAAFLFAGSAVADPRSGLWVQGMARPVVQARIDPIIAPGSVGGHVHNVYGASNFRTELNTFAESQNAECVSYSLQDDKSNYWAPMLYHIRPDGKYEPVTGGMARMYYKINGDDVQPFPEGMRMITGRATDRNIWDERVKGLEFECSQGGNEFSLNGWLPNGTSVPGGCDKLYLGISFPSCGWANQSLDSWDHWSHLTWPVGYGGGEVYQVIHGWVCPPSHPIKYPHIFMQSVYTPSERQRSEYRGGDGGITYILSNGDTTGTTFHADFINGWDTNTLRQGIEQCGGPPNLGDALEKCAPFNPTVEYNKGVQCRYQGMIPNENIGYWEPLDQLPGCNPRWDASGPIEKPNDCPWFTGNPDWAVPTALYGDLSEYGTPHVVELAADGSIPEPNVGTNPYTTPWGVSGKWRFSKFENTVITVNNSQSFGISNQRSNSQVMAAMKDLSVNNAIAGTGVPESKYQTVSDLYVVPTTWLVDELFGLHRPVDITPYQAIDPTGAGTATSTPTSVATQTTATPEDATIIGGAIPTATTASTATTATTTTTTSTATSTSKALASLATVLMNHGQLLAVTTSESASDATASDDASVTTESTATVPTSAASVTSAGASSAFVPFASEDATPVTSGAPAVETISSEGTSLASASAPPSTSAQRKKCKSKNRRRHHQRRGAHGNAF